MNCPRCNTPLMAEARFCGVCGTSIPPQPASAPPANPMSTDGDATLILSPSQGQQRAAGIQQTAPAGWQNAVPQGQPPVAPVQGASWQQPEGTLQATQGVSWQQPPLQPARTQSGTNYQPGALYNSGTVTRPKRRKRIGLRVLLSLIIILGILAGVWFLGVRPYLHGLAQTQLDQALTDAESQILLLQAVLPTGSQVIHASESDVNSYLGAHDTSVLQNLHMVITPENLQLDFKAYGFDCSVLAVPVASGGELQITNVQVQGVLWLIMSDDELTTDLNNHFLDFGRQMHRAIKAITLRNHVMDLQVS